MKRIYYLLALMMLAFASCQKQPVLPVGVNAPGSSYVKNNIAYTLTSADYKSLPNKVYPTTTLNFATIADAKTYIPTILNTKYPQLDNGSTANITFSLAAPTIKLADSTYANTTQTLSVGPPSDYTFPAFNGKAANTFNDLSATAVLNWLYYKFQTPQPNELHVLTYLYFESGKTASSGTTQTDAFLFLNNAWTKIYHISNAQYASTNNGVNNWYVATDVPNLPSYFNNFLKNDPTVMLTAKFGDVIYVNYRYLVSNQKVMALTFDGTNWTNTSSTNTQAFQKISGSWAPDNTVFYTMVQADYTTISTSTFGSALGRANIASFPDFNTSAATDATYWSDVDITSGIGFLLKSKYGTTAVANQKFSITYTVYNFGATSSRTKTYQYDGTNFNFLQ